MQDPRSAKYLCEFVMTSLDALKIQTEINYWFISTFLARSNLVTWNAQLVYK